MVSRTRLNTVFLCLLREYDVHFFSTDAQVPGDFSNPVIFCLARGAAAKGIRVRALVAAVAGCRAASLCGGHGRQVDVLLP